MDEQLRTLPVLTAGTLIALILRGRLVTWSAPARLLGVMAGVACWFGAMLGFRVQSWEPQPTAVGSVVGWLLILMGTCLMFLSTLGLSERYVPKVLAYLGRISYGLYLFHSFIFFLIFEQAKPLLNGVALALGMSEAGRNAFGTVFVLLLSVVVAHFSFRYFESFFLKLKRRFTLVQARD